MAVKPWIGALKAPTNRKNKNINIFEAPEIDVSAPR